MNSKDKHQVNKKCNNCGKESSLEVKSNKTGERFIEKLLMDYEIISDEDISEPSSDFIIPQEEKSYDLRHFQNIQSNKERQNKLTLNLNPDKIALKPCKESVRISSPYKTSSKSPQSPLYFTIEPKSKFSEYNKRADGGKYELPEIVLTSYQTKKKSNDGKQDLKPIKDTIKSVTSHVIGTAVKSPVKNTLPLVNDESLLTRPLENSLLLLSPLSSTTFYAEVVPPTSSDKYKKGISDSGNVKPIKKNEPDTFKTEHINSHAIIYSPSPESLLDNVLSAASSTSVTSSSNSNNSIVEVNQLPVMGISDEITVHRSDDKDSDNWNNDNDINLCESESNKLIVTPSSEKILSKSPEQKYLSSPSLAFSNPFRKAPQLPTLPRTSITNEISSLELNEEQILKIGEAYGTKSNQHSPICVPTKMDQKTIDAIQYPQEYKCIMCSQLYRDPRMLNCLHSFCFQCLIEEFNKEDNTNPFCTPLSGDGSDSKEITNECRIDSIVTSDKSNYSLHSSTLEISTRSGSDDAASQSRQRLPSFSFRKKKPLEKSVSKPKSLGKTSNISQIPKDDIHPHNDKSVNKIRVNCKICNFPTELPLNDVRQLPVNYLLRRKIDEFQLKTGNDVISTVWCSQCLDEATATYHCISCCINLCKLCKESHIRQRSTANHKIENIIDLRRSRRKQQNQLKKKITLQCTIHSGAEIKTFCRTCLEVACAECVSQIHKGHKQETIHKAIATNAKLIRDSVDQARPLCKYAEHSLEKLNNIAKGINRKCDETQRDVEEYMMRYFEALEVHKKTLLQQVHRVRESKIELILEQQMELEQRTNEARELLRFVKELSDNALDVELLSFIKILLARFEYCQKFKTPVDPKISDTLKFLRKIEAPTNKNQNHIPLYGVITLQTVDPTKCTLKIEGFTHLRMHRRVELLLETRDTDGETLCHGGLQIQARVKYKEPNSNVISVEINDHRDGSYVVAFTPQVQGIIVLSIIINDKRIQGSPFCFSVRPVRPHSGIYHCCVFCSSKNNKLIKCSCGGQMPNYEGCGHGHAGHPGHRHWSCCGNIQQNSECAVANKLLNS